MRPAAVCYGAALAGGAPELGDGLSGIFNDSSSQSSDDSGSDMDDSQEEEEEEEGQEDGL